jgi:hypothetical protein
MSDVFISAVLNGNGRCWKIQLRDLSLESLKTQVKEKLRLEENAEFALSFEGKFTVVCLFFAKHILFFKDQRNKKLMIIDDSDVLVMIELLGDDPQLSIHVGTPHPEKMIVTKAIGRQVSIDRTPRVQGEAQ